MPGVCCCNFAIAAAPAGIPCWEGKQAGPWLLAVLGGGNLLEEFAYRHLPLLLHVFPRRPPRSSVPEQTAHDAFRHEICSRKFALQQCVPQQQQSTPQYCQGDVRYKTTLQCPGSHPRSLLQLARANMVRSSMPAQGNQRIPAASAAATPPEQLLRDRLQGSMYVKLRTIRCRMRENTLVLTGLVPTFYLKQVATSLTEGIAGVARVSNEIRVMDSHQH